MTSSPSNLLSPFVRPLDTVHWTATSIVTFCTLSRPFGLFSRRRSANGQIHVSETAPGNLSQWLDRMRRAGRATPMTLRAIGRYAHLAPTTVKNVLDGERVEADTVLKLAEWSGVAFAYLWSLAQRQPALGAEASDDGAGLSVGERPPGEILQELVAAIARDERRKILQMADIQPVESDSTEQENMSLTSLVPVDLSERIAAWQSVMEAKRTPLRVLEDALRAVLWNGRQQAGTTAPYPRGRRAADEQHGSADPALGGRGWTAPLEGHSQHRPASAGEV